MPSSGTGNEGICWGYFRCCPYGCFYTIPFIFAMIAFSFASAAAWTCYFFEVTYLDQGIFSNPTEPSEFTMGPWTVQDFKVVNGSITSEGHCVSWNNHETLNPDDLDTTLEFARGILFIVFVLSSVVTICFCMGSFFVLGKTCLKGISCCFFMFALLFPTSLACFASEWCKNADTCTSGASSVTVIVAFVCWICAGVSIRTIREREIHEDRIPEVCKDEEVHDVEEPSKPTPSDVEKPNSKLNPFSRTRKSKNVEEPEPPLPPRKTNVNEYLNYESDGTIAKIITTTVMTDDGSTTVTVNREVLRNPIANVHEEFITCESDGTIAKIIKDTVQDKDGATRVTVTREVLKEGTVNAGNQVEEPKMKAVTKEEEVQTQVEEQIEGEEEQKEEEEVEREIEEPEEGFQEMKDLQEPSQQVTDDKVENVFQSCTVLEDLELSEKAQEGGNVEQEENVFQSSTVLEESKLSQSAQEKRKDAPQENAVGNDNGGSANVPMVAKSTNASSPRVVSNHGNNTMGDNNEEFFDIPPTDGEKSLTN